MVIPLRPSEKRDPVIIGELAQLGLQNSDPHSQWCCEVYMLGALLVELSKECARKFPPVAIGSALVYEIQRQAQSLFDDRVPPELTTWPNAYGTEEHSHG